MKIKMFLLSDTIFGSGMTIPGGEDISIQADMNGFPYMKGSTLKGLFREHLELYCGWTGCDDGIVAVLLGREGADGDNPRHLIFSDLKLSEAFRERVTAEIGNNPERILHVLSNVRTFTSLEENGSVKEGSLRTARCVNRGLCFHGSIEAQKQDEELVREILGIIKNVGTLRSRGFGNVRIEVEE